MSSTTSRTVYVNGVAGTTDTTSSTVTTFPNNVTIGAANHANSFDNYFTGLIDEPRIYNRALSATEIQALYAQGKSDDVNTGASQSQGTGRLDSGLAGYWRLDDGSGTSATDSSVNGNTGNLTNGPTVTPGKVGQALSFDGSDDYVSIAHSSSLNITSAYGIRFGQNN